LSLLVKVYSIVNAQQPYPFHFEISNDLLNHFVMGWQNPQFIAERQTWSSQPDSRCNQLWPSFSFPRKVAGGPLDESILKCQLKAIDLRDYPVSFTADELQRLRAIFPSGVCDWSRPGVNQTGVVTWASFGPAPENLVFDVTRR